MRFTLAILSAIAAVASAQSNANPFIIPSNLQITAGQPYTIKWTPTTSGPVSLTLRSGASSNLNQGTKIATGIDNSGSYTFTLPADTTRNSDYTLQITSDSDPSASNYTPQFVVESKNTVASMSSASGSASATATSGRSTSSATGSTSSGSASTTNTSSRASSTGTQSSSSSTGSATSSATRSATAASSSAASAPTNAAGHLQVQGGLAAVLIGAAALL